MLARLFSFWSFKLWEIESLCVSKTEMKKIKNKLNSLGWLVNGERWIVGLYQMVKRGLRVNSIRITWECPRNANSLAQLQTLLILEFWEWGPETCALSSCPSSSDTCYNLDTNGLKVSFTAQRREHGIVKLCVLLIKLIKSGKKSFVVRISWFAPYSITS